VSSIDTVGRDVVSDQSAVDPSANTVRLNFAIEEMKAFQAWRGRIHFYTMCSIHSPDANDLEILLGIGYPYAGKSARGALGGVQEFFRRLNGRKGFCRIVYQFGRPDDYSEVIAKFDETSVDEPFWFDLDTEEGCRFQFLIDHAKGDLIARGPRKLRFELTGDERAFKVAYPQH